MAAISKARTGVRLGGPSDISSPERLADAKEDGRSGLFFLETALFELRPGEKLFWANGIAVLLFQVATQP